MTGAVVIVGHKAADATRKGADGGLEIYRAHRVSRLIGPDARQKERVLYVLAPRNTVARTVKVRLGVLRYGHAPGVNVNIKGHGKQKFVAPIYD